MSIAQIKAFSEKAKTDPELKEKLLAVQKIRELITLGKLPQSLVYQCLVIAAAHFIPYVGHFVGWC